MKTIILALSFLIVASSAFAQKPLDRIVYSINNRAVTSYQLGQKTKIMVLSHGLSLSNKKQKAEATKLALNSIIEGILLEERGRSLGANITSKHVEDRLRQFQQKLGMSSAALEIWLTQNNSNLASLKQHLKSFMTQEAITEQFVKGAVSVSDKAIAQVYNQMGPTEYAIQARHILFLLSPDAPDYSELKSIQYALEIRKKLLRKEFSFSSAAKRFSNDPSAQQNAGNLGTFKQGMMVSSFTDAATILPIGQISFPVRSQFGYHLIQVTGRKKVAKPALKDDSSRFQQITYQALLSKKRTQLIQSLKKDAQIIKH